MAIREEHQRADDEQARGGEDIPAEERKRESGEADEREGSDAAEPVGPILDLLFLALEPDEQRQGEDDREPDCVFG